MRYTIVLLTILPSFLSSQNLVVNAGFETHLKPLERLQQAPFLKNIEFSQTVQGWESFSRANMSALFSTKYKATEWQAESLGYNFKKCQPYEGNSMIRLLVNPKGGQCGYGSGGYIQSKLSDTLRLSSIYSVSFWIFIPKSDGMFYFPMFPQNFGIAFSDKKFKGNSNCMEINDTPFTIDTIDTEVWYKIEFFIKPTKPLSNIALGLFFNPQKPYAFPDDDRGLSYYFFVDNVEIHTVSTSDINTNIIIEYPFLNIDQKSIEKNKFNEPICLSSVYFDKNSDTLNTLACMVLDSLILMIKDREEALFSINGHTDILGQRNIELSERRAINVRNYLIKNGQFNIDRFELNAFGSDSMVTSNRTEMDRKMNRRVEIKELSYSIANKYYRLASMYVEKSKNDSAFHYLFEWLKLNSSDGILLLHDPDLTPLHSSIKWRKMESLVRLKYKKFGDPDLAFRLDNLYFKDQLYRSIGAIYKEAKGYTPIGIDSINSLSDFKVLNLDSINADEAIRLILELKSWPEPLKVGNRQSDAIFYSITHSNDLKKMKKTLPILEKACQNGYIQWSRYAIMFDKAHIKETGYQCYGTQFSPDPDDGSLFRLSPIENPEKVNEIRAKISLPPLDFSSSFRLKKNN